MPALSAAASRIAARPARKADLSRRLLTALDQKMTEFETRIADGATPTAADSERDARTLNTLVRLFEKLRGFGEKSQSRARASDSAAPAGKDAHDADRLRNELAQRLERLRLGIGG